MKKTLSLLCLILLYFSSSAQKTFSNKNPVKETAAVEFNEATPSLIFFGADDHSKAYQQHRLNYNKVSAYFGEVYADFPVFDLNKGNLVAYHNQSGPYFFYRPNARKPFGMVISNGKDEPILVSNPDHYLKTIKTYLNIGTADDLVPKTYDTKTKLSFKQELKQLMGSTFKPDQQYAEEIIQHSNSIHYLRASIKDPSGKCTCSEKTFQMYEDSLMQKKMPVSVVYQYNNANQIMGMQTFIEEKENSKLTYIRAANGLIEKMISSAGGTTDTVQFIYEKDRYHTLSLSNGHPYLYETFYLNDQKQCVRRFSNNADQTKRSETNYIYDQHGRLVRESNGQSETVYQYQNDSDDVYSISSDYQLNPRKLTFHLQMSWEQNRQILLRKDEKQQQLMKTVVVTDGNCNNKTYTYDKDNQLTSMSTLSCKKLVY